MNQYNERTSAILVSDSDYQQAKQQAALLAYEGRQVLVFCNEGVMRRYLASLVERQELQRLQRCRP